MPSQISCPSQNINSTKCWNKGARSCIWQTHWTALAQHASASHIWMISHHVWWMNIDWTKFAQIASAACPMQLVLLLHRPLALKNIVSRESQHTLVVHTHVQSLPTVLFSPSDLRLSLYLVQWQSQAQPLRPSANGWLLMVTQPKPPLTSSMPRQRKQRS